MLDLEVVFVYVVVDELHFVKPLKEKPVFKVAPFVTKQDRVFLVEVFHLCQQLASVRSLGPKVVPNLQQVLFVEVENAYQLALNLEDFLLRSLSRIFDFGLVLLQLLDLVGETRGLLVVLGSSL